MAILGLFDARLQTAATVKAGINDVRTKPTNGETATIAKVVAKYAVRSISRRIDIQYIPIGRITFDITGWRRKACKQTENATTATPVHVVVIRDYVYEADRQRA